MNEIKLRGELSGGKQILSCKTDLDSRKCYEQDTGISTIKVSNKKLKVKSYSMATAVSHSPF